jgi:hypothetical protein
MSTVFPECIVCVRVVQARPPTEAQAYVFERTRDSLQDATQDADRTRAR